MADPEQAKNDYVQNTTAKSWEAGMSGTEGDWSNGIMKFCGTPPGPQTMARYKSGIQGKGSKYEQNTNRAAADRWFSRYVKKIAL